MNFKEFVNRHHGSIRDLSGVLTAAIFLSTVVGSYRFFLVLGIFFLLKALKLERPVLFIFLPAYVVTFYLDITNGPMFLPGTKSHFLLFLPLFLAIGSLADVVAKRLIINLTDGKYFVICPACRFHNVHLVEQCNECTYQQGAVFSLITPKISPSFCGDKVEPHLLDLLRTGSSEEILFHKKLTYFSQKLKNGIRQARKHLFITTSQLIILDYYSFRLRTPNGWREKDIIPLSDILSVEGTRKRFYNTLRPFLIIKTTNNDVYEIILSSFGDYIAEINSIAAIINKANQQVQTDLNALNGLVPDYTAKDRRLLLMLPLILLLLALAVWNLFQYIQTHGLN